MSKVYLMVGLAVAIIAGTVVYIAKFEGRGPDETPEKVATPAEPKLPEVGVAPPPKAESGKSKQPKATQPSFDVVRIAPDGSAVLAGRARPGDKVTIMNGDQVVGIVTANPRGEWALVPEKPLKPGATELKIVSERLPKAGKQRFGRRE